MKKILYITSSFTKKGSASIRNFSLVEGFLENNCQVEVLTQKWPSNMEDESLNNRVKNLDIVVYKDYVDILFKIFSQKEVLEKRNKFLYFFWNMKIFKIIRIAVKNIIFYPDLDMEWIRKYNKNIEYSKYDLIISSSDTKTSHYIGRIIKRKYNKTWFTIWGDPWFDDKGTKGIKKVIAYFSEKKILKAADKNIYVSYPTSLQMKKRFKSLSNKIYFFPRTYLDTIISDHKPKECINILYAGSIYYGRNITNIISSIENYNMLHEKKIILNIYGILEESLKKKILMKKDIKVNEPIPYEELKEIIKENDILLFLSNGKNTTQIPGKIYDYFGTDKVILALFEEKGLVYDYIYKTKRCCCYLNIKDKINLEDVVYNIGKNNILYEFSGKAQAKKILELLEK